MKIHFEVTAEDIACGSRASSNSCPIARCISRTMGHGERWPHSVEVELSRISFDCNGVTVAWNRDVPEKIRQFIDDFDSRRAVKPFGFTVRINDLPDSTPNEATSGDRIP